VFRLVRPSHRKLRALRTRAEDAIDALDGSFRRARGRIAQDVRERLLEQVARVESHALAGNAAQLENELKALDEMVAKEGPPDVGGSALDAAWGIGKMLLLVLFIRLVIVEPFYIPSGSMIPTLQIGDQVMVNRFLYGVRLPYLNKVPFVLVRPPRKGDVIVFNNPLNADIDLIKRVVGVPGDTVEVRNEVLYVNGEEQVRHSIAEKYDVDDLVDGRWYKDREVLYEEILDGRPHAVLQKPSHPKGDVTEGPFVVPEGHVFVMGDNRDNSSDGRSGFGISGKAEFVPYGHIKGKAMIIWLSLARGGLLSELFNGWGLRTDRLFLPVR
jgi:signal peptidase I